MTNPSFEVILVSAGVSLVTTLLTTLGANVALHYIRRDRGRCEALQKMCVVAADLPRKVLNNQQNDSSGLLDEVQSKFHDFSHDAKVVSCFWELQTLSKSPIFSEKDQLAVLASLEDLRKKLARVHCFCLPTRPCPKRGGDAG